MDLAKKNIPGSSPLTLVLSKREGQDPCPGALVLSVGSRKQGGTFCGLEVNQNYICFREQKQNKASTSRILLFPRKTPLAFYILYFSVSSITISMCGGCCEVLLKLALLHPRHGQGGHASRKGSGKPVAAVTWRKQPAQLATCSINLCRLQRRSPASAKHTRRKL